MRLAKYLAHAGVASRRAAETMIGEGRVRVGGEVVRDPARDVDESSGVEVDGRPVTGPEERVVYAVNKPLGVLSTARDPYERPTIVGLAGDREGRRLYPVGRLDADSTGLILLTNDGDLAHRLTHPSFEVPKTYRATVAGGPVGEAALRRLREGVMLEDGMTGPARVRRIRRGGPGTASGGGRNAGRRSAEGRSAEGRSADRRNAEGMNAEGVDSEGGDVLEIAIGEGRNRQVRRMCEAVGHPVIALQRIAFGPLELGRLAVGERRRLSEAEVQALREAGSSPARSGPRRPRRKAGRVARGPL